MRVKSKLAKLLVAGTLTLTVFGAGAVAMPSTLENVVPNMSITAFAENTKKDAEDELKARLVNGKSKDSGGVDVSGNAYKTEGGGSLKYTELTDRKATDKGYINEANFNKLKGTEKTKFLTDMNKISEAVVADNKKDVTDETRTTWLENVQNCEGVGSQLMSTLLQNTKPDYATANRIYEPFSGVVGTILALGAILIMAFLGITMVLDLSYIGIPAFRNMLDGDDSGNAGSKGKPKFISHEARSAVQEAEGGNGGSGQSGEGNKVAIALYFKRRVIMLVVLGVCLLYLVQGQIYTLVSWILDLLSGFLGF